MTKLKVIRGIDIAKRGKDPVRVEPGKVHARSWLEGKFGKKVIANWLKTGVLVIVERDE